MDEDHDDDDYDEDEDEDAYDEDDDDEDKDGVQNTDQICLTTMTGVSRSIMMMMMVMMKLMNTTSFAIPVHQYIVGFDCRHQRSKLRLDGELPKAIDCYRLKYQASIYHNTRIPGKYLPQYHNTRQVFTTIPKHFNTTIPGKYQTHNTTPQYHERPGI